MNQKRTVIAIIILVLLLATVGWFYVEYRSAPEAQAPVPPGEQQINIVEDVQKNWATISTKFPVQAGESGRWYIDALRTLSPSTAFIAFEDGLNGHSVIITSNNSDYEVKEFYEFRLQFSAEELAAIETKYGDPNHPRKDYGPSEGDGRLIETSINLFLQPVGTMPIKVALLNTDGTLPNQVKPGDISGCDHVVLIERSVPTSNAPLRAALNLLLTQGPDWSDRQIAWGKLYNYANQGTLVLDSVSIVSGVAKVYLKGTPPPLAGVCDEPRLFIQIAQTARQFSTVEKVELYVNGVANTGSGNQGGF